MINYNKGVWVLEMINEDWYAISINFALVKLWILAV